jgi:hypothetical protein
VLFVSVAYDALHDRRLAWLGAVALVLLVLFGRRETRFTRLRQDLLVDLRPFRMPSYTAGVLLALIFFPAVAGLPLVLTLDYQQGSNTPRLNRAFASPPRTGIRRGAAAAIGTPARRAGARWRASADRRAPGGLRCCVSPAGSAGGASAGGRGPHTGSCRHVHVQGSCRVQCAQPGRAAS